MSISQHHRNDKQSSLSLSIMRGHKWRRETLEVRTNWTVILEFDTLSPFPIPSVFTRPKMLKVALAESTATSYKAFVSTTLRYRSRDWGTSLWNQLPTIELERELQKYVKTDGSMKEEAGYPAYFIVAQCTHLCEPARVRTKGPSEIDALFFPLHGNGPKIFEYNSTCASQNRHVIALDQSPLDGPFCLASYHVFIVEKHNATMLLRCCALSSPSCRNCSRNAGIHLSVSVLFQRENGMRMACRFAKGPTQCLCGVVAGLAKLRHLELHLQKLRIVVSFAEASEFSTCKVAGLCTARCYLEFARHALGVRNFGQILADVSHASAG